MRRHTLRSETNLLGREVVGKGRRPGKRGERRERECK